VDDEYGGHKITLNHFRHVALDPKTGQPTQTPKALVFYTHGYGDYGSRYAYVGNYLSKLGIEMAGLDQRGFGDSEGEEGKIVSFEVSTDDNKSFFKEYIKKYPHLKDVPKFLMTGSWGCQIALYSHL